MHIGDAGLEIVRVAHGMFPETALPDAALGGAAALGGIAGLRQGFREVELDEAPARREIGVAVRQGPDAVQVIGQHADGERLERPCAGNFGIGGAQVGDLVGQQAGAPVKQVDREEIRAARHIETTVIRHGPIPAKWT